MQSLIRAVVAVSLVVAVPFVSAQTLQDAVKHTLETNPEVLVSLSERLQVKQQLKESKAGYAPTVNLSATIGKEDSRNDNTNQKHKWLTREDATLEIIQNLFRGLETKYLVEADKHRVNAAGARVENTAENVALLAVEAYLNVIRNEQLVEAARDNVVAHSKTSGLIGKRTRQGLSRESELRQAEGRLALAEANFDAEINNSEDAKAVFLEVVGQPPANLVIPQLVIEDVFGTRRRAVDTAVATNPALKVARTNIDVAKSQHKATKSTNFPSVDFVARSEYGRDNDGLRTERESNLLGVVMNYNLFRGGADMARQKGAAYQHQQTTEEMERTKRQVVKRVEFAWNSYQTAKKRIGKLKQHALNSELTIRSYQQQYILGKRTLIDLLNAENEYFSAKRALINGEFDLLASRYRLLNSVGILRDKLGLGAVVMGAASGAKVSAVGSDSSSIVSSDDSSLSGSDSPLGSSSTLASSVSPASSSLTLDELVVDKNESTSPGAAAYRDETVVAQPQPVVEETPASVIEEQKRVRAMSAVEVSQLPFYCPKTGVRQLTVIPKATLWSISKCFSSKEPNNIYQTMNAIFDSNPHVFGRDNMYLMHTGEILTVPSSGKISGYTTKQAQAVFNEHTERAEQLRKDGVFRQR